MSTGWASTSCSPIATLDRAERWFDGRGESVVLFARLIPLVRSFISLAAGLAEMALGQLSLFTVLGCGILVHHVRATRALGYSLGSSWHKVAKGFSYVGYLALGLAILAIVTAFALRVRAARRARGSIALPAEDQAGRAIE